MIKSGSSETLITPAWCSYAGSMHGILASTGFWKDDFWKFYSLSGLAWHFIVHENCCPSSVTVYHWSNEHYYAMDRLGIFTSSDELIFSPALHTFSHLQKKCIEKIKRSLDIGRAVLVWAPGPCMEFGIIKACNDAEKYFMVEEINDPAPDPLLYENLGLGQVPVLYCQYVLDQVAVPLEKSVMSSLMFGLSEWNKASHFHPHYASGRKAYDLFIQALNSPGLSGFGLGYLLAVYHESKNALAEFMVWASSLSKDFSRLEEAALLFRQVAECFQQMQELWAFIPNNHDRKAPSEELCCQLKDILERAREREQGAMKAVKKVIQPWQS